MAPRCILHVPHSSTDIPADLRSSFLLSEEGLQRELLRMTDRFTDELFSLPAERATTIRFPVSRLVVDPERFLDDAQERMAERGMGVIYTRTADGGPLRADPGPAEKLALVSRFYDPHHRALANAVESALDAHGSCLIVDGHSFPSVALPCDLDQAPDRPDICIGIDPYHTPEWLTASAVERFAAEGFSVAVNQPYSGAVVPSASYGRDRRVASIMIEINRGLYMDEAAGDKSPGFGDVAGVVQGAVAALLAEFHERSGAGERGWTPRCRPVEDPFGPRSG